MPISIDTSVSPYHDDYDENKNYYKILFRPGVAVQTRELNQMQTMLQKQIERFGDNVLKKGTIIDGCDITFHSTFPYVKIRDVQTDGAPVNVNQYIGYYVKNEANIAPLVAAVQTVIDGYESRAPDLKTLYLRYISTGYANIAGVSTEQVAFSSNQSLTVYDPEAPIELITSFNDSAGFSNTDSVVILSAIAVQNSTGGKDFANNFYVGDHINDGTANVQVVGVDSTSNSESVILRIRPRAVDLQTTNSLHWSLYVNTSVQSTNAAPSDIATISDIIGSGASAILRTGAQGEVASLTVTSGGSGYYTLPTVSIASNGATTSQITTANLVPQTYLTKIAVANDSVFSVGTGYAMSVGKGIIYQKGYFSRVNEHLVVVDKYANTPDAIVVGFDTTEEIINSNQDPSLLDNSTGEPNETAPGANRLQLEPILVVKTKAEAEANTDFLSIAEFSNGNPYKQNRQTVYNIIGNEMARRTYEESGNYVVDQFILASKAANNISEEASSFKIQIDPGVAYVNGKRIETTLSYESSISKGTDTFIASNATVSLNYGNYIRVSELSGVFKFNIGDLITLYPAAGTYYSAGLAGTVPTVGSLGTSLGTARIRSLVYESGTPGTAECVYRLYLFDIRVATARNFGLVRSVFYNGTIKGIADVVPEGGLAVLKDNNLSSLLYYAGSPAVKTGNSFSYVYRTINDTGDIKLAANGIVTIAATGSETFPYTASGDLSTSQENDIIITPLANVEASANIAGSISCNTTSPQVNGSATSFTSTIRAGDFIKIANTVSSEIRQVSRVANDTVLILTTNGANYSTANAKIFFPSGAPISLSRETRTANVDSNSNNLTINVGLAVNTETNVAVAYNVRAANVTPVVKTVNRNRYVRLQLSNNAVSNTGPWVLGIPDVFRLGGVYVGPDNTFAPEAGTDITSDFYIDHNQTENYYGISYLFRKAGAVTPITTSDFLLVKLDHFTDSGEGLKAPGAAGTYAINDGITLVSSSSTINTLEIPEVFSTKGIYYDLRDQFDFRPRSANTVAANTNPADAPINPVEPSNSARFTSTDKKFPAPDSSLTGVIEYYQGRVDRVVIDENNDFHIIKGTPGANEAPSAPNNALTINTLNISPYPSHPFKLSAPTVEFADASIVNEKYTNERLKKYRIQTPIDNNQRKILQPRGYTMVDIGKLERRISDLEYYVQFTLVEALVQKKNIPSSANSNLDRAKFGFFVDSFDNYNYSDLDNPNYNAVIIDGFLSPKVNQINLPLKSVLNTDKINLPYIEKSLVTQQQATDGPLVPSGGTGGTNPGTGTITVTPVANTAANTEITQTITSIIQNNKTTARSDNGSVYEEFYYTMSQQTGPVNFYLNARDNNMAAEVFQSISSGGPWNSIITSASAGAITTTDINTRGLNGLNGNRKIEHPGSLVRKSYGPVGFFLEDQFKLTWTHNPTNGWYYKIRIYKGKNHGAEGAKGTFGYKLFYPIDSTVNAVTPINGFTPTTNYTLPYVGTFLHTGDLRVLTDMYWEFNPTTPVIPPVFNNMSVSGEQAFNITVTGLKPNTSHRFYFEGQDLTHKTKQEGQILGAGLMTNASGALTFVFYYHPEINSLTQMSSDAAAVTQSTSVKSIRLVNSDGSSSVSSTIQIQSHVKDGFNTPITSGSSVSFAGDDTLNSPYYNTFSLL